MGIVARNFGKLIFLALAGGMALGFVMARRGVQVDLGTIGGVKLALSAPAVTKTPAVPAGLFPGSGATPGASGQPTTGTVQQVSGDTLSVSTQDGAVTKARVTEATTYVKDSSITLADIRIGETVTALGQAGPGGVMTATLVTVGAAAQAGTSGASGQVANLQTLTGAVQMIEGSALTVAVAGGPPTRVALAPTTRLLRMSTGTLADVTAGSQVTIAGQAGADGTIAATAIRIGASR